jgi:hypothetical protein
VKTGSEYFRHGFTPLIGLGGDDAALFPEILRMDMPTVVTELVKIVGRGITAAIAGVKDRRTVSSWIRLRLDTKAMGPTAARLDRLRVALRFALVLSRYESKAVVSAWFCGVNPYLANNQTPAQVIRDGDLSKEGESLAIAARILVDPESATELWSGFVQRHGRPPATNVVKTVVDYLSLISAAYVAGGVSTGTIKQWAEFGGIEPLSERRLATAYSAIETLRSRGGETEIRAWFYRPIEAAPASQTTPASLLHDATSRTIEQVSSTIISALTTAQGHAQRSSAFAV